MKIKTLILLLSLTTLCFAQTGIRMEIIQTIHHGRFDFSILNTSSSTEIDTAYIISVGAVFDHFKESDNFMVEPDLSINNDGFTSNMATLICNNFSPGIQNKTYDNDLDSLTTDIRFGAIVKFKNGVTFGDDLVKEPYGDYYRWFADWTTTIGMNKVKVMWDANVESDLAGYRVYYGLTSGDYNKVIDVGNQISCIISGLLDTTYYFAVTAYDTSGNESDYSDEVSCNLAFKQMGEEMKFIDFRRMK